MKTAETKLIEYMLFTSCFGNNHKLAKEYGTSEVTIGFQRNGHGKELVDFLSYDAKKDIFKCYEIKVSMSDFRSKAKKSWYGNYNYLAVTVDIYKEMSLSDWKKELPDGVSMIVINTDVLSSCSVIKAKKQEINEDVKNVLKDSLLRTLFYQNTINHDFYLRKMMEDF